MNKMKTHKGLAKRVKISKNGKVKRSYAGKSHLNSGLSPKRRRSLRRKAQAAAGFKKRIKRALGNSG
ncbi:MAG: 50S ribosomal protein L35 [Planctomycetes bacterium]|nr:50S ribosomal protein L35 [Planctomycetota bacterium]